MRELKLGLGDSFCSLLEGRRNFNENPSLMMGDVCPSTRDTDWNWAEGLGEFSDQFAEKQSPKGGKYHSISKPG